MIETNLVVVVVFFNCSIPSSDWHPYLAQRNVYTIMRNHPTVYVALAWRPQGLAQIAGDCIEHVRWYTSCNAIRLQDKHLCGRCLCTVWAKIDRDSFISCSNHSIMTRKRIIGQA